MLPPSESPTPVNWAAVLPSVLIAEVADGEGAEVLGCDLAAADQDHRAFHEVPEFAHVAGPFVAQQGVAGFGGEALGGAAIGGG